MTSLLNVELVYVILKSITSFAKSNDSGRLSDDLDGVIFKKEQDDGGLDFRPIDLNRSPEKITTDIENESQKKRMITLQ